MKLRLRGDVHRDLEVTDRLMVPNVTEQLLLDGAWFRVVAVSRGFVTDGEHITGWDMVAVVRTSQALNTSDWAPASG